MSAELTIPVAREEILKEKKWLSDEFNYLEELEKLLEEADKKLPRLPSLLLRKATEKSIRRKCFQIVKKVGRIEKKVNRFEKEVEKLMTGCFTFFDEEKTALLRRYIDTIKTHAPKLLLLTSKSEGKIIQSLKLAEKRTFNRAVLLSLVKEAKDKHIKNLSDALDNTLRLLIVNEAMAALLRNSIETRRNKLLNLASRCQCPLHTQCHYEVISGVNEGYEVRHSKNETRITTIPGHPAVNHNTARNIIKELATGKWVA